MDEYKKSYLTLFNAITDALGELEKGNLGLAADRLKAAQQAAEDQFIEADNK